nr:hypothetical protein B0A51_06090 [Rachicladosporium sp. CCFEE 5018]
MYRKALLFGYVDIAKQIVKASSPRKQKGLGATVAGFNDAEWEEARSGIVERGSYLKFIQGTNVSSLNMSSNDGPTSLKKYLLGTKDLELVEAIPFDRIWGIGYRKRQGHRGD